MGWHGGDGGARYGSDRTGGEADGARVGGVGEADARHARRYAHWARFGFRPYGRDPAVCGSPRIAELGAYWAGKARDGHLPGRGDIDPAEIVALLPYLLMMDVEHAPLRVRYRLVGTAIAEASRRDFTGLYLDEMSFDDPAERQAFVSGYRLLVDSGRPVYGRMVWLADPELPVVFESAIFPLATDGRTVEMAIALEDHARPIDEIASRLPPRQVRQED
jgi:hypothetical protein